jgi:hypothetical protein
MGAIKAMGGGHDITPRCDYHPHHAQHTARRGVEATAASGSRGSAATEEGSGANARSHRRWPSGQRLPITATPPTTPCEAHSGGMHRW